jgi:hypothetical protein
VDQEEDDESAAGPPKKVDPRLHLARFNAQTERLFELLRAADTLRLAQSVVDPEPVDPKGGAGGKVGVPPASPKDAEGGPSSAFCSVHRSSIPLDFSPKHHSYVFYVN